MAVDDQQVGVLSKASLQRFAVLSTLETYTVAKNDTPQTQNSNKHTVNSAGLRGLEGRRAPERIMFTVPVIHVPVY